MGVVGEVVGTVETAVVITKRFKTKAGIVEVAIESQVTCGTVIKTIEPLLILTERVLLAEVITWTKNMQWDGGVR